MKQQEHLLTTDLTKAKILLENELLRVASMKD